MTSLILKTALAASMLLAPVATPEPTIERGWASHYSAGVMRATIRARQGWGHIPDGDLSKWSGFVARPRCGELGDTVWLRRAGKRKWRPFLVVDCAVRNNSDGALEWMESNRILVEVDWNTAEKWGGTRGGVAIEMKKPRH